MRGVVGEGDGECVCKDVYEDVYEVTEFFSTLYF